MVDVFVKPNYSNYIETNFKKLNIAFLNVTEFD